MKIEIRKADLSDLDLLVQWRMETLHEVFSDPIFTFPEDLEEQNRAYYQWALPAGEHIACFACADGQRAGCGGLCLYQEMPSPENPGGRCAFLMNIYCRPAYRRHGIGEAVVRWLLDQAKERKVTKIYLETTEEGRPLYEKIGFTDMKYHMILPPK